jgi:DNA repair photolyase
VTVRENLCKSILNESAISRYSLNCYTGCAHGCVYCYARFMQRFHPHPEPWGQSVDVKTNAADVLARRLRRARPGPVFMSSACDGWQPLEAEWRLTRRCCEMLLRHGFEVNVLTKSALVLRDLDLFRGKAGRIGVTLTTLDARLAALWEPQCATPLERVRVIEEAHAAGLKTSIMFGPLLPFLSDGQKSLDALLGQAAALEVDAICVDALNPRSKVWPAVAQLLRTHFPQLTDQYRQVLFRADAREAYLEQLRRRVLTAASHHGICNRISVCF